MAPEELTPLSSMWNVLGFRRSIYFTEPLEPNEEGHELFVGREEASREFLLNLSASDPCITIIGGRGGIGKTSFLNYNQYICSEELRPEWIRFQPPKLLPAYVKIQLTEKETATSLILRTISAFILSISKYCTDQRVEFPLELDELNKWFRDLILHTRSYQAGISALGFGGSYGKSLAETPSTESPVRMEAYLEHLHTIADVVQKELGFVGIFAPLNNLDIMNPDALYALFNVLRDTLFSVKGFWWVLVGLEGTQSSIDQRIPRVGQRIRGSEIKIEPLSFDEVQRVLDKRAEKYRIQIPLFPKHPIDNKIVRLLYDTSEGEVRFVFNMCERIVLKTFTMFPSLGNIGSDPAEEALREIVKTHIDNLRLQKREFRIIIELVQGRECRPKDYESYGFRSMQAFHQVLARLVDMRLLSKRQEGLAVYYKPSGIAILAHRFNFFDI